MKQVVLLVALALSIAALLAGAFLSLGFFLSPQDQLVKADAIVAISGGDTTARVEKAVQLYKDGWAPTLIFSGAALDPSGPSNASSMATIAESQGIPASHIILEEKAVNTYGNATGVATIAKQRGLHSIILVTSPYHQRRASIAFHRALGSGVTIINHSSVDNAWRRSRWWATAYSRDLTISELQKVIYQIISGHDS